MMVETNIVLTGFMGTGKSTVGKEVAAQLGRPFLDLDEIIADRAGKSIADIFAQDGEPTFRSLEAQVCNEVREPAGQVIAAGGGAVLNPANRDALAAGGTVICLQATPEVIARRLAGGNGRPLLSERDAYPSYAAGSAKTAPMQRRRIAELLAQREAIYAALPHHLDTSSLSVAQAAERVMGLAAGLAEGGHKIPVGRRRQGDAERTNPEALAGSGLLPAAPPYDVLIAEGLLDQTGARLAGAGLAAGRCAVITNTVIGELWGARLVESLAAAGFDPVVLEVPEGEAWKTLATAGDLFNRMANRQLARGEVVIALGGGVIGDLAGFVAATWLRGVPFVQIPTSLLAMVDASVGGKVAVDLPQGKNLVGAFKGPAIVLTDPLVLRTLPGVEFRSGLAEVAKAALIGDPALFEQLAGLGPASLTGMIADAVRVKVRIVERDPFEAGERAWLNLGHTFGHALELVSGYSLRHGEAVGLGMIAAAELSASLRICDRTLPVRVRRLVERLGLPLVMAFDPDAATAAMRTDKKRRGLGLRFVLPRRIGEIQVVSDIPEEMVRFAWDTIRARQGETKS
jgi:shikimate kinase/3-dehydroquinate synthase